jgi:hypothetical protein
MVRQVALVAVGVVTTPEAQVTPLIFHQMGVMVRRPFLFKVTMEGVLL